MKIEQAIIVEKNALNVVGMMDDETGYTVNNQGAVILWHFDGDEAVQLGVIHAGSSGKSEKELAEKLYGKF